MSRKCLQEATKLLVGIARRECCLPRREPLCALRQWSSYEAGPSSRATHPSKAFSRYSFVDGGPSAVQRRSLFIQTQPTPNPSSLMFLPGKKVMESGSADFTSAREAMASPLATKLFQIDGVVGVFFGSDFITITKQESEAWSVLKPLAFGAIMDHFTSGETLFRDGHTAASDTAISDDDSEVVAMIKELLETRIKPAVMEDGGDIVFVGFDEATGVVTLKMQGACSGCPSSSVTLKSGIENMLMHYIPEVKEVVQAPADEVEQASDAAFRDLERHLSN